MPEIELQLNDKSLYPQTGKDRDDQRRYRSKHRTVSLRRIPERGAISLNSGGSGNVIIPVTYDNCVVPCCHVRNPRPAFVFKVVDERRNPLL